MLATVLLESRGCTGPRDYRLVLMLSGLSLDQARAIVTVLKAIVPEPVFG